MLQQQQQQQEQQEHQAQSNFPSYLSFLDSHIKIPRAWSPKDKCQLLSLSKQNCRVSYNGKYYSYFLFYLCCIIIFF